MKPADLPYYLTFEQAGEFAHVSPKTVDWWTRQGRLPRYKPGRHPLVKRDELFAFIESTATPTVR